MMTGSISWRNVIGLMQGILRWIFSRVLMSVLLVCIGTLAWGQEDCILKKNKDGVKVYACHNDTAKFKFIKAEVRLQTSLNHLQEFLLDVENYTSWQYKMIEATVLEEVSEKEMVYRSVIRAPWPVTNREMIVRFNMEYDSTGNAATILVNTVNIEYPEDDKLVRVPFSEASWKVTSVDEKDLLIQYSLRIDPGGSVPAWLVNMAITEGPYISFKNLKEQIVKK